MGELGGALGGRVIDPGSAVGVVFYATVFALAAVAAARAFRMAVARLVARTKGDRIDQTAIRFISKLVQAGIYAAALVLFAHVIPELRSVGTAVLAGVSVASIVFGLAAQATLANVISGVALVLYRPFRVHDTLQMSTPAGPETCVVEEISLGYTFLRTADGRLVVAPNSALAGQITVNVSRSIPGARREMRSPNDRTTASTPLSTEGG